MDRLSPLDSAFLHVEDGVTHMHIASCAIFEGPAPAYDEFVAMIAGRLPVLVRYRQKVRFVPGGLGPPVWVDDPHFDLGYHLRHTALPAPGGEQELENLMGRLMSVELDRRRPLWEGWMVDGLTEGRWAVISKVHHCMVDGVSGTDLMVLLLDPTPEPSPALPDAWSPRPEPTGAALTMDALMQLAVRPAEQARALGDAIVRRPRRGVEAAIDNLRGFFSLGRRVSVTPALSIEGTIGPHRRWAAARADLGEVKGIGRALGGSVNDVVLTAITGAFRRHLLAAGDDVDDVVIHSLVPVSVRASGDSTPNNQVSLVIAKLPVGIADPVERFDAIRRDMAESKASHQVDAGQTLTSIAGLAPPTLYALGLHAGSSLMRFLPQRNINTVTTNVPGPPQALYAAGRKLLEYLPFVPISQGVRLGVAILSYDGRLAFGVTGDYDTVSDVESFCRSIEAEIADLQERAPAPARPAAADHAKHPRPSRRSA